MFGNGGTVSIDVRIVLPQQNGATVVTIQPDGKIVAIGNSNSGLNFGFDFAAVRLHSNGSLDSTFATGGKLVTSIGSGANKRKRDTPGVSLDLF